LSHIRGTYFQLVGNRNHDTSSLFAERFIRYRQTFSIDNLTA
jgi:hypothetical protein